MGEDTRKVKKVCECRNCGNEAEMIFECRLEEEESVQAASPKSASEPAAEKALKATATCTHCGNEADMWIDM